MLRAIPWKAAARAPLHDASGGHRQAAPVHASASARTPCIARVLSRAIGCTLRANACTKR